MSRLVSSGNKEGENCTSKMNDSVIDDHFTDSEIRYSRIVDAYGFDEFELKLSFPSTFCGRGRAGVEDEERVIVLQSLVDEIKSFQRFCAYLFRQLQLSRIN